MESNVFKEAQIACEIILAKIFQWRLYRVWVQYVLTPGILNCHPSCIEEHHAVKQSPRSARMFVEPQISLNDLFHASNKPQRSLWTQLFAAGHRTRKTIGSPDVMRYYSKVAGAACYRCLPFAIPVEGLKQQSPLHI